MQSFQVSRTIEIASLNQLQQYQIHSPIQNVENKSIIKNFSIHQEMMNTPLMSIKQTPQSSRVSDYRIQFKVSGLLQQKQQDETNTMIFQSIYPIFQSPQNQISYQPQFIQFQSPILEQNQLNYSQNQPFFKQSIYYQNNQNLNFTNIQEELEILQLENLTMIQEIQKLEQQAQRGQSTHFIEELEDKIEMLSQMNKQLLIDNRELTKVPNPQVLRDLILKYQNDRKLSYNQLIEIKNDIQYYRMKQEELKEKLRNEESKLLNNLVQEFENKIQAIILENDRINSQLRNQEKIVKMILKQKYENEKLKKKLVKIKKDKENTLKAYNKAKAQVKKNKLENCQEKLDLLKDENRRLLQIIKDSEMTQIDLHGLYDKIQIITQDNERMMRLLDHTQ